LVKFERVSDEVKVEDALEMTPLVKPTVVDVETP